MSQKKRLKQSVAAFFISWVIVVAVIGYTLYMQTAVVLSSIILALAVLNGFLGVWMFNASQQLIGDSNKNHSRTKRQLQELQLKIDRHEYDAKKSVELRRIVLNSTQEKDHALQSMALALDHAMDEVISTAEEASRGSHETVISRAQGMKRYAADLQALAKLELKSELPEAREVDLILELERLQEQWSNMARSRKIRIKLENPEDQIVMQTDISWIENLLTRLVYALVRMNYRSQLTISLIAYTDADMGDALRMSFSIAGRSFTEEQLQRITTDYTSVNDGGEEVGPGLTLVVARRVAQMLNGNIEVENTDDGLQVVAILPRSIIEPEGDELL